ncbi:hypothetical protein N9804_02650, partial [Planktomarina temperata]|nr:hypothetical protein [Planktomarina temperata]
GLASANAGKRATAKNVRRDIFFWTVIVEVSKNRTNVKWTNLRWAELLITVFLNQWYALESRGTS